ncbi:hypothetical protein [Legionella pneumophila]|uniref:hypothetical protein n=1 Tax=Legionella pneumophila TaxID=446 RepID=UPI000D082C5C|nr:hypothetical protein [Legionella pneumophila]
MSEHYTAKIYCGTEEIARQSGENLEQLYVWMLAYAEKTYGKIYGEITDKISHQVVRRFKKQSIE